jgi:hypothetical protein
MAARRCLRYGSLGSEAAVSCITPFLAAAAAAAAAEGLMEPLENYRVKCMSMGFFMKVGVVFAAGHY